MLVHDDNIDRVLAVGQSGRQSERCRLNLSSLVSHPIFGYFPNHVTVSTVRKCGADACTIYVHTLVGQCVYADVDNVIIKLHECRRRRTERYLHRVCTRRSGEQHATRN
jgi:hypothetical protein